MECSKQKEESSKEKLAAEVLKRKVEGFIFCPDTNHGWIYGKDWFIEF